MYLYISIVKHTQRQNMYTNTYTYIHSPTNTHTNKHTHTCYIFKSDTHTLIVQRGIPFNQCLQPKAGYI